MRIRQPIYTYMTSTTNNATASPPPEAKVDIKPNKWMLPDRAGFSEWVSRTFVYGNDPSPADPQGTRLFPQQRFVRDYIQADSPYGGLVLYHGLGVGKSCAAVAAIRALEAHFRVVVMLPASIISNFITEMRRCGGHQYAEEQKWRFDAEVGTWWADKKAVSEGTWFGELDAASRQAVREQLNRKIRERVQFISYNGISGKKIAEIASSPKNMFDGAVVVIDEVHNFVSQVIKQRNVFLLYERMMAAEPRKVILLTGTPFMNNVMELPYLINLANGFEKFLEISVSPAAAASSSTALASQLRTLEARVREALEKNPYVNRAHVGHASSKERGAHISAVAHLTPNGFVRTVEDANANYFVRPSSVSSSSSSPERSFGAGRWMDRARVAVTEAVQTLTGRGSRVDVSARNKLLLPVGDAFLARFTTNMGLTLKNVDALARRIQGTVSYFGAYDPALYPRLSEKRIVECPMSARQFDEYKDVRVAERRLEEVAQKFARALSAPGGDAASGGDGMGAYRPRSRAIGNFVFPSDIERPQKKELAKVIDDDTAIGRAYDEALAKAVTELREKKPQVLRLDGALREHSPKFHAMLRHFHGMRHLALVYSEFRTMEGVGLLSACLDANEYSRVYVKKVPRGSTHDDDNAGRIVKNGSKRRQHYDYRVMETVPGAPNKYMIHDNSDPEAANIALNAYNSEFDRLPQQARDDVRRIVAAGGGRTQQSPSHRNSDNNAVEDQEANKHGRLAKLLLVTKSGAEGINLKNVREVHIMEPFWNSNRIDQVVGRAVRAKSHVGLPEEERRVEQFLYMSVFTPAQAEERAIKLKDEGKTSDQHVYAITLQKDALVGQMLRVLKTSAVDCLLHERQHRAIDAQHACLRKVANLRPGDFAYGMSHDDEVGSQDEDDQGHTTRLVAARVKGKSYFLDTATNKLYDYALLKEAGELREVGSVAR